jgi:hypothetical protein
VPVASVLLSLGLVMLLVWPLVRFSLDDAAAAELSGLDRPAEFLRAWRLAGTPPQVAALYRVELEPGWPERRQPPRLAVRYRLPPDWTVLRLTVEDLGLVQLPPLDPAEVALYGRLEEEGTVQAFILERQLVGLPAGASGAPELATWRQTLHGTEGYRCWQLPLVCKSRISLADLEDPVLVLGDDLELALVRSRSD